MFSLSNITKNSDIAVTVGIVAALIMLIVPIPAHLLDLLLTLNIALGLLILLLAMYTKEPLDFSVFPSLLLMVTLFRLSLNVSGTRLILLHGYAGNVIESFGKFVVGGNYIIGFIIFVILITIQFVVITQGASRVAEVAARFTLDAMPGKQMSIDADLNAGLITQEQAKERREKIQNEADFYGSMDGASRFIKGDAIAAIIILIINILGGFFVGIIQKNMSLIQALKHYTLLTVGEGIVTQIPALLISTATGIIVTRAASKENLADQATKQLLSQPRAMFIVSGILLLLFLIPGLPKIPFIVLAIGIYILARAIFNREKKEKELQKIKEERQKTLQQEPESVIPAVDIEQMELEIGYGLIPLVDEGGNLLERITKVRKQVASEIGIIVPPIRVRDNMQLKANNYVIKIYGQEVGKGQVYVGKLLALKSNMVDKELEGIETIEPAFNLPAVWINPSLRDEAEMAGYTVIDPTTVILTHLTEVLKNKAHLLLGRQELSILINAIKEKYPVVVEELIPDLLTLGQIQKVLHNLLKEKIPIVNLLKILEVLSDNATKSKDINFLTEQVRLELKDIICKQYIDENNTLYVMTLDPNVERVLLEAIKKNPDLYSSIDPQFMKKLYEQLLKEVRNLTQQGYAPILLVSPAIRLPLRKLTEEVMNQLIILSYKEITASVKLEILSVVKI